MLQRPSTSAPSRRTSLRPIACLEARPICSGQDGEDCASELHAGCSQGERATWHNWHEATGHAKTGAGGRKCERVNAAQEQLPSNLEKEQVRAKVLEPPR